MSTEFWDKDWRDPFAKAIAETRAEMMVISPFVQRGTVERLLIGKSITVRLITRFSLVDFYRGVSDINAMEVLLQRQAKVKGIRNLHAKVYIFDSKKAFVTSANLTQAGLSRNHEFGAITDNPELVASAVRYFEALWDRSRDLLTAQKLAEWQREITNALKGSTRGVDPRLRDYGTDVGIEFNSDAQSLPVCYEYAPQFFVKFFGRSNDRIDANTPVMEEIRRSGCHRACTYPKGVRPRRVKDGAVMFMARMVKGSDMLIFGRAIGRAYRDVEDDASEADIRERGWKTIWPHYIRVRAAEFLSGVLKDGISLNELMQRFGQNSFTSTATNPEFGAHGSHPRRTYMRKADVELTPAAAAWLNAELTRAMAEQGRVSGEALDFP